ncbi:LacI family transcriptional regulator [bacterium]|nr:MAG: LacI family transcriptional regulator [bacterium]
MGAQCRPAQAVAERSPMTSIADVAREAGVSESTASRALRDMSVISPTTVARVQEAARKLNYVAHRGARNLAQRRTNLIVLFASNLISRQTDEFHDGAEEVCIERGYMLLLQKLDGQQKKKARYLHMLREQRVDGVIVVPNFEGVYLQELANLKDWDIGVVQIDNRATLSEDYVGCDNRMGARLVAEHLLALGHRSLGVISSVEPLSCIRERVDGFQDALKAAGLSPAAVIQSEVATEPMEHGRQSTHRMIDLPNRPTAIFCTGGPTAVGALRAVRERKLRCPDDIAIAAFDDDLTAPFMETSLTAVHWPAFEIGRRAAELLIARIEGSELPPQEIVLPPHVVYRESTLGRTSPDPV